MDKIDINFFIEFGARKLRLVFLKP